VVRISVLNNGDLDITQTVRPDGTIAFFPGGDIGCLAVHGTVNDLSVAGARAAWRRA